MLIHRLVGGTIFLLLTLHAHAQQDAPVEVTPAMQEKIMAQVKKDVRQQQGAIPSSQGDRIQFDFKADTAIVEQFESKWITLDYSDFGMRDAAYAAADLYDSLLNKYYNMLLATLKGQDKERWSRRRKHG